MRIGCSTLLYGGHPLEEALPRIRASGAEAIELCSIENMAVHFDPDRPETWPALRRRIDEAGLAVESIGASGRLGGGPDGFTKILDAAAALGAPAVTTGPGGSSDDEASFAETVRALQALGVRAKERGVVLSIKPHVRQAVYSTPTALRFMAEMDAEAVGLNFDASHLWRADETPEDSAAALAPHLKTARFRDTKSRETALGGVDEQTPGHGAMNLVAVLRELEKNPALDTVTLEIVGTKDWELDAVDEIVRTSVAYAANVLGEAMKGSRA